MLTQIPWSEAKGRTVDTIRHGTFDWYAVVVFTDGTFCTLHAISYGDHPSDFEMD